MKRVINTGLPALQQPFEWAVACGHQLYTAHGPVRADGSICVGSIEEQAELTFANLRQAVQAAGGALDGVVQMTVYMTHEDDMEAIDHTYRKFFSPPYPNRCAVVVKALAVKGMAIEIQAVVHVPAV